MRQGFVLKRAVPVFALGIALFLAACQAVGPVRERAEDKAAAEAFAAAETYRGQGLLDKALERYAACLRAQPRGPQAALALHRMADIHRLRGQKGAARNLLENLLAEYPEYPQRAQAALERLRVLQNLGEHGEARKAAVRWLQDYPEHPERVQVLALLGEILDALGQPAKAFFWRLKAHKDLAGRPGTRAALEAKLRETIHSGDLPVLQEIVGYAAGTSLAPEAYHRLSRLYLEAGALESARGAAAALLQSTADPQWKLLGERLMAEIASAAEVRTDAVGCLLPLTGPFAIYGEEVLNGIQLGLFKQPAPSLELIVKNSASDPDQALAALEMLVREEKVVAVIGPLSSRVAGAVAPRAQELGVPLITLTQKPDITAAGDMVFRNFITPRQEVRKLVDTALERGIRRYAILYPQNPYGRLLMDLFWDRLEERGAEVTAVESYDPEATDFADEIKKMVGLYYPRPASVEERLDRAKPPVPAPAEDAERKAEEEEPEPIIDFGAVFIPDIPQRVVMIAPQLVYHDVLGVQLLGTALWQSTHLIDLAEDYVQGAVFTAGFYQGSQDSLVRDFLREYRESYEAEPGILAASGYDTVRLLAHLLGSESVRTRRDLQALLAGGNGIRGLTGRVAFDGTGEVIKDPLLLTISGREIRLLKPHAARGDDGHPDRDSGAATRPGRRKSSQEGSAFPEKAEAPAIPPPSED